MATTSITDAGAHAARADADKVPASTAAGAKGYHLLSSVKDYVLAAVNLISEAANSISLRNGVNGQSLNVYNTYTSGSVFERGIFRWVSNVLEIGNETTGGTLRTTRFIGSSINLFVGGASRLTFGSGSVVPTTDATYAFGSASNRFLSVTVSSTVRTTPLTFATLPTAATAGPGAKAYITDCNSTTFNATAAGGGANSITVTSDGTNWKVGG